MISIELRLRERFPDVESNGIAAFSNSKTWPIPEAVPFHPNFDRRFGEVSEMPAGKRTPSSRESNWSTRLALETGKTNWKISPRVQTRLLREFHAIGMHPLIPWPFFSVRVRTVPSIITTLGREIYQPMKHANITGEVRKPK